VIEHLAATMSLDELREVFYDTLDEYAEKCQDMEVCSHPIDLHTRLVELCEDKWDALN
jgi:hypothetical protein